MNLSDEEATNMNFMGLYGHCDVITSRLFSNEERSKQPCTNTDYTLSQTSLDQVNQTTLATLVLPLSDPVKSRDMYISKQLRRPLEVMYNIINDTPETTDPKFMMYSAHDWTVATMQMFFNSTNGNFTVVPYAA